MGGERIDEKVGLSAAVIVAHPDDETLWAGGYILSHPEFQWYVFSLCRANDPDRSTKFFHVLQCIGATGCMADLDDGPEQVPLPEGLIAQAILSALPAKAYHMILTHAPHGEYTRHRRHEEVSKAVSGLWQKGRIHSTHLWMFAYQDHHRDTFPQAVPGADHLFTLPAPIWKKKYELITIQYGFDVQSWEAQSTPKVEAFWTFSDPKHLNIKPWLDDPV